MEESNEGLPIWDLDRKIDPDPRHGRVRISGRRDAGVYDSSDPRIGRLYWWTVLGLVGSAVAMVVAYFSDGRLHLKTALKLAAAGLAATVGYMLVSIVLLTTVLAASLPRYCVSAGG